MTSDATARPSADGGRVPPWQTRYVVACAGLIAGMVAACAADFGRWPRLMYLPYARRWLVGTESPGGIAMMYPGIVLWGVAAALGAAAVAAGLLRWRRQPLPTAALRVTGAWAMTAGLLGAAYFTWMILPG